MPSITPFLWFSDTAEAAAKFYVSVFPGAKILKTARYGTSGPGPAGSVMTVQFRLLGQEFTALNGGPHYTITPAVSFVVHCRTQREIDRYWKKLAAGGKAIQCGWLEDKFGVSWQIVPRQLGDWVGESDPAKSNRVMHALLKMKKLDLAKLKQAYAG